MNSLCCGDEVLTCLGRGKVVYLLPDTTVLVEFPWGGGKLFFREELQSVVRAAKSLSFVLVA